VTRSKLIQALFVTCIAAYPFIVFFGLKYLPPSAIGLVLLVLLAMRFGVLLPAERPILLPMLLVFVGYALTATLSQSEVMLLYYPAVVNFTLFGIFLNSLRLGDPLLLRIIHARGLPVSEHGHRYLYVLTAIWSVFFVVNGLISIWTSTLSLEAWTLYNGFLSYCAIGVLFGVEYVFRLFYYRRMGIDKS